MGRNCKKWCNFAQTAKIIYGSTLSHPATVCACHHVAPQHGYICSAPSVLPVQQPEGDDPETMYQKHGADRGRHEAVEQIKQLIREKK